MKKKIKTLVTGGAGFIGSNLVEKLLKLGYFVRVVDNFSTGREENIKEFLNNKNFEFIKGDLADFDVCKQVVKDIDYIFHVAAIPSVPRSIKDPLTTNQANVLATLNLLIAARDYGNIKKFVYSSSGGSIYGDSPKLPKEETDPVDPISPYALSKYTGERYCQIFSRIYNLPTICLRYFNVFGLKQNPISQYAAVIPKFIFDMLQGKKPAIYGDGKQTRDFTYVDNVVEANILAAFSNISDEVINIACEERTSVNDIIKFINQSFGTEIKPKHESARPGDVKHSLADISKAEKLLKYKPEVYFKEGLEKTINYFKKSGIREITDYFASIRLAKEEDVEQISQIYRDKVKTGFVSSLGIPFLNKLYQAIIKSEHGLCIVIEIDNKIAGFVVGAFDINRLYRYFSIKQGLKTGPAILLKALNPRRFRKIFETLFYPRERKGLPKAELIVAEVEEGLEDQELRNLLFNHFVAEMRKKSVKSFKATTSEKFKSTIDFYKKIGFKFHSPIKIHKGESSHIYIYNIE